VQTALRLLTALGAAMAPAMAAQMVLVQSARGQAMASDAPASLPPAPYAAAAGGRSYPSMGAYDRYGAGARAPAPVQVSAPTSGSGAGPRLSWSGKTEAPPQQVGGAYTGYRSAYAAPTYAPAAYAPPVYAPPAAYMPPAAADPSNAPPPRGWTFVAPIGAGPQGSPASTGVAPSSIYDPPPPMRASAAAPPAAAQTAQNDAQGDAGATGPRHYSVHRDYGIEPDPIPLPPQFFGATADLTQPATQDPIRKTTLANGKTVNPLQPEEGQ